jgi:hypothetical protein
MKKKKRDKEQSGIPIIYGDPIYDADEDIYAKGKKLALRDEGDESDDVKDHEINPGGDLDVPGTEEDDADEKVGSEDEENNYYSIGGDNHDKLKEGNEDEVTED